MSDGSPGQWEDAIGNDLYIDQNQTGTTIDVSIVPGDGYGEPSNFWMSPGQARSVAAKLIELADLIENMPSE